jgi:hypothetical protein
VRWFWRMKSSSLQSGFYSTRIVSWKLRQFVDAPLRFDDALGVVG